MVTASIDEAESQLSQLIQLAEQGENVIIARAGKPVARLIAYREEQQPRQGGQWRGRVRIASDFDELPPDIASAT
ncbi:MAG: type II toxin-antitoxin system Phd/YefM family antitoxin [Thermoguttaceae bacterium]|jgi:prevent-host-death family protein